MVNRTIGDFVPSPPPATIKRRVHVVRDASSCSYYKHYVDSEKDHSEFEEQLKCSCRCLSRMLVYTDNFVFSFQHYPATKKDVISTIHASFHWCHPLLVPLMQVMRQILRDSLKRLDFVERFAENEFGISMNDAVRCRIHCFIQYLQNKHFRDSQAQLLDRMCSFWFLFVALLNMLQKCDLLLVLFTGCLQWWGANVDEDGKVKVSSKLTNDSGNSRSCFVPATSFVSLGWMGVLNEGYPSDDAVPIGETSQAVLKHRK